MRNLLLIDGNAIMHRAYHALPLLTAPDGTVINAVYGFFSMVLTVITDLKPEYVVVCFDRPKPTFRQALFAGYQQGRAQMTDDLGSQFQMIHEILAKMHIAVFELDGYEADDLIGTIARQAAVETIILTGDRDMLQLVNDHVKILMPIVGVKQTLLHDEKSVEEKYGVKPSQFVDYKALIGDASDGYPGVTGIGPKTAASLLQKHKTFENIYEKIGQIPEKLAAKLAIDAEQAALAKKLATIVTDVPITCRIEECRWMDVDTNGVQEVFNKFGFNSLQKRFAGLFKEVEDKKKGEQMDLL